LKINIIIRKLQSHTDNNSPIMYFIRDITQKIYFITSNSKSKMLSSRSVFACINSYWTWLVIWMKVYISVFTDQITYMFVNYIRFDEINKCCSTISCVYISCLALKNISPQDYLPWLSVMKVLEFYIFDVK